MSDEWDDPPGVNESESKKQSNPPTPGSMVIIVNIGAALALASNGEAVLAVVTLGFASAIACCKAVNR